MSVKQSCCVHSQHDHEGSLINNTDFVTSSLSVDNSLTTTSDWPQLRHEMV